MSSYRNSEISRILVVIIVVSMISTIGCTRAILVPDKEWDQQEVEHKGAYRIRTIDGLEIKAMRFVETDSSLVIYEYRDHERGELDPLELPKNEIESITKSKTWWSGTIIGIVIIGSVAYIAALVAFTSGLDSLD